MTALAIINGIAVVVLVLVTGYYAWQTREMAREMRTARLLGLHPKLVLDVRMIGPTFGDIVVRNVGPGAAIDADLTLAFEESEGAEREEREWLAHVIAPGEEHEFLPAAEVRGMDDLVARHPFISLSGRIRDALGQTHEVDERIASQKRGSGSRAPFTAGSGLPRRRSPQRSRRAGKSSRASNAA